MDEKVSKAIKDVTTAIAGTVMATIAVGAATSVIAKLLVTDAEEGDLTGKKELHPTEDKVAVSEVEAGAAKTDGAIAKDGVAGTEGAVKANETEAKALTGEATAAESGATAVRTKAGATDIEVKALKMT